MDIVKLGPSVMDEYGLKWVLMEEIGESPGRVLLKDLAQHGPWEDLQEEITRSWIDWFSSDLGERLKPYKSSLRVSVKIFEKIMNSYRAWYHNLYFKEFPMSDDDLYVEFLKILDVHSVDWEDLNPMESSLFQTLLLCFTDTLQRYLTEYCDDPDLIPALFRQLALNFRGIVWMLEPNTLMESL